uniref:VOC domain-containing protein n=1 Tax=Ditylenchus dipsaci TaxID=166011 RepID=A0A915ELV1_9BILA
MPSSARALHYVFKIGNREASYNFYIKKLGMQVLRHEEFGEGCEATCNGPYGGKWSKTMVGYGPEDAHFVLELTYNYGIDHYQLGNDFHAIHIESTELLEKAKKKSGEMDRTMFVWRDPDEHQFFIKSGSANDITKVSVNVKDFTESKNFWSSLCKMTMENSEDVDDGCFYYAQDQCKLELRTLKGGQLKRDSGAGRIAFSVPEKELPEIQERLKKANPHYIQHELKQLDTDGKATVSVVICRDPNDHEICFVGDEAYRELSKVDPKAEQVLLDAIKNDESVKNK